MAEKKISEKGPIAKASSDDVVTIDVQPFLTPISILLGAIIISVSLLVGLNGVDGVSSGSSNTNTSTGTTTDNTDTADNGEEFPEVSTSIDDDPYIGNKDTAKIAIVEYSDYECPFCKRHFEQVYPQLKKEYIDTGKAILVFRDYPLPFHDPNATDQAMAAECVQELNGNGKYFEFHDLVFKTTTSNKGLAKDRLYGMAESIGVDKGKFTECLDSGRYAEEVKKDVADGQEAGIGGTPGFVVGTLKSDGTVDGKRIDGAYPLTSFQSIINEYL